MVHVVEDEGNRSECKTRLEEVYGPRLDGVKGVTFDACRGRASMEILRLAKQGGADLIIMAHHSKERDPEKAFLGSTVTQVALNAPCPTMSVNRHLRSAVRPDVRPDGQGDRGRGGRLAAVRLS